MFFLWLEHLTPTLLLTAIVLKLVTYKPYYKHKNLRQSLCVMTSLVFGAIITYLQETCLTETCC